MEKKIRSINTYNIRKTSLFRKIKGIFCFALDCRPLTSFQLTFVTPTSANDRVHRCSGCNKHSSRRGRRHIRKITVRNAISSAVDFEIISFPLINAVDMTAFDSNAMVACGFFAKTS